MAAVIIRAATTDDLAALLVDVTALHAGVLPNIYPKATADAGMTDYLRRVLVLEDTHLFVAETDSMVVGVLILQRGEVPRTPVHVPRRWVTVDAIVVREAFRRRGIGEALMEQARAWANERGIDAVELMVAEFNTAAIAWYEKLGYTSVYRRMTRSVEDGNQPLDVG